AGPHGRRDPRQRHETGGRAGVDRRAGRPDRAPAAVLTPAYGATAASASGIVNAPEYSALPTIAPSTPMPVSDAMARRSSRLETPPEATTGLSVCSHTWRSRSRFGPLSVPSFVTSVTT